MTSWENQVLLERAVRALERIADALDRKSMPIEKPVVHAAKSFTPVRIEFKINASNVDDANSRSKILDSISSRDDFNLLYCRGGIINKNGQAIVYSQEALDILLSIVDEAEDR